MPMRGWAARTSRYCQRTSESTTPVDCTRRSLTWHPPRSPSGGISTKPDSHRGGLVIGARSRTRKDKPRRHIAGLMRSDDRSASTYGPGSPWAPEDLVVAGQGLMSSFPTLLVE